MKSSPLLSLDPSLGRRRLGRQLHGALGGGLALLGERHPERLQQQVDALGSVPGAALCFGKFQYIDAEGTVISPPLGEAVNQRDILELNFPMLSTLMVRRSSVAEAGGFD